MPILKRTIRDIPYAFILLVRFLFLSVMNGSGCLKAQASNTGAVERYARSQHGVVAGPVRMARRDDGIRGGAGNRAQTSGPSRISFFLLFFLAWKCKVCCDCDEQTIFHETTPSAQPASHSKQRYARTFAHAKYPVTLDSDSSRSVFQPRLSFPSRNFSSLFYFPILFPPPPPPSTCRRAASHKTARRWPC